MTSVRLLSTLVLLIFCSGARGQTLVGISLNIGDRQQFAPDSPGFSRALAPSGSLFINHKWIQDRWVIQGGATAGVASFNLKVKSIDTLTVDPTGISPFPVYNTLFGSVDFLLGHEFTLLKQNIMIGAGGGVTYYASIFTDMGFGVDIGYPDNTTVTLFDAQMTAPANKRSPFWKVAVNYDINTYLTVVAEYVYHARPFAEGTYEFFHTKTPQAGGIEVYQRELRLGLSYVLGKRRA